ncbi:MAG: DUF4954 family protein, partial [Sedimentisphaerales bacterium]|nr:DUF4954 family protein [Sedimentisphaerales bacterium]
RDGAKWPSRDRRKGKIKRDLINFEVFSPYIVGKMIKANDALKKLQDETDKSVEEVSVGGALVRRPILRTGQKFYRNGIEMYLMEKTFEKMESALAGGLTKIQTALANDGGALYSEEWVDICGQLMPQARLEQLHDAIGSGKVKDLDGFIAAVNKIFQNYAADEWVWVKQAFKKVFSIDLDAVTKDDVAQVADGYLKTKGKFLKLVLNDANKEFDELSHSGFGQDGNTDDNAKDFEEIRGCYADNKFVKDMQSDLAELESRVKAFLDKVFSM